jgi:hypothetical protein
MKTLLLVLTISILFPFVAYSQLAFESGYFINEDGQKIDCMIENVDWHNNPTEFKYQLSGTQEIMKADVNHVKEFAIPDVCKFISAKVNIDRSGTGTSRMNTNKHPVFNEEQLFLKVLVEGGASLFFYEDVNGRAFFYQVKDSVIKQLIYKEYLTRDNMIATNTSFRQQLYNDLKCQDITMADLEDIKYSKKSLERVVVKYNRCTNSEYHEFKTKENADRLTLTVRPGLQISSLSGTYSNTTVRDFDFSPDLSIRLGIEAELILPIGNKRKWALIGEPTYQSLKSSKRRSNSEVSGGILISSVDYRTIEVPLGVRRYFFLKNGSKIFVNAALVADLKFNSSLRFARANGSLLGTEKVESNPNMALGVGYKHKGRYSLELRHRLDQDVIDFSEFESSYKTFSVIFGYSF